MAEDPSDGDEDNNADGVRVGLLASDQCFDPRTVHALCVSLCGFCFTEDFASLCSSVDVVLFYLLAPSYPRDEGFVVPSQLASLALVFLLHVMHLWASLVFPMEVVMSSIEGEMNVARVVPSFFEVELDAFRFAWKCCLRTNDVLTLDCKGVDASFCVVLFHVFPIEVEILYSKLELSLMDKVVGAMPIPIILVEEALAFEVEILFGDVVGVYPSPIEVSRQVTKAREIYVEAKEEEAHILERFAKELERKPLVQRVEIVMSNVPLSAAILWKMEELGFSIMHGYGLIETAGLVVSYAWKMQWNRLPGKENARLKSRQEVRNLSLEKVDEKSLVVIDSTLDRMHA
ncbi:hypothetical protein SUGI_0437900 [Cryptomeria japonica]|nr:hypothetical protein SUGI_0437900 [Cryptomeria japonica]